MQKLNELVPVNPGNIGGVAVSLVSAKNSMRFSALGVISPTGLKGVLASTASLLESITSLLKV